MASRLERFSLGLHIDIPHKNRRNHHETSIEISTNYVASHQDLDQLEHQMIEKSEIETKVAKSFL